MKKILIAVDFTPAAQKVAETGYAVAKAMQAEVALVHVIADAAWYAAEYSPIMGYVGGYTAGTVALVDDIKKEAAVVLLLIIPVIWFVLLRRRHFDEGK